MNIFHKLFVALVAMMTLCAGLPAVAQTSTVNHTGLWWNPAESGWGVHLDQQGDIVFAALYTYRAERTTANNEPEWFVMSRGDLQANGSFTGDLYRVTGTPYNVSPFVPLTSSNVTKVGTMTVTFTGISTGTLAYTADGASVQKSIQKQVFGSAAASCTFTSDTNQLRTATNYTGLWWNPNESGWGIPLTHQDDILFAVPFIYDGTGRNTWVVASNLRKQADGTFYGDLYRVIGSAFNASPFVPLTGDKVTVVGTMRLTFIDGNTASLVYSIGTDVVVKTITRQVFNLPTSICTQGTAGLSYTDKVYAIWTAASPYAVTKTGVTPVVNKTSYTTGNFPIFNCGIANKPLSDGKVLLDCQARPSLQAFKFYIDPTTDTMYNYTGTVPADITFTFVQTFDPNKPEWGVKTKVSDGWYFTTFDVTWVLKFQFDQGGTIITIKAGTFATDGSINVLASFSH